MASPESLRSLPADWTSFTRSIECAAWSIHDESTSRGSGGIRLSWLSGQQKTPGVQFNQTRRSQTCKRMRPCFTLEGEHWVLTPFFAGVWFAEEKVKKKMETLGIEHDLSPGRYGIGGDGRRGHRFRVSPSHPHPERPSSRCSRRTRYVLICLYEECYSDRFQ